MKKTNKAIQNGKYDLLLDVHTFYNLDRVPYIIQRRDHAFIVKGSKGFEFLDMGDDHSHLHDHTQSATTNMDTIKVVDAGEKNYNLQLAKRADLPAVLIEFHGTDDKNDHKLMDGLIEYILKNI